MPKILVVDSDALNLKMTEFVLNQNSFEVATATSGDIAIDILKHDKIDLVLMDIGMPIVSGLDTLKIIRADIDVSEAKVIFMTATANKEEITEALRLGVLDFIKKPFLPAELVNRVSKAIEAGRKDTVLVVDDNKMNLLLVKRMLEDKYKVVTVTSGAAALDFIANETPDLVLLDLHMPGMDGFEVFDRIKAKHDTEIPVIFLTADSESETEIKIFKAGAADYISKPFVAEVVVQRIHRTLELRHLQRSLARAVEKKTLELTENSDRFARLSSQVMLALARTIDAKDKFTNDHSLRVAKYSREIARRMGKTVEEVESIYFIALLHDIGKIGVPSAIINKEGGLEDDEFEIMKMHPLIGAKILSCISEIPELSIGAHWHHERYDGLGYPDGLKGSEIPEIARIICVADCYDSMSSIRSYRGSLSQEVIAREIKNGKGLQFDPAIADYMLDIIKDDVNFKLRDA